MDFKTWVSLPSTKELGDIDLERYYYERVASESEFLNWYKSQDLPKYEKPGVAIDLITLSYDTVEGFQMLFIKRAAHPFKDHLAFAGGFVEPNESSDDACLREVEEELSLKLDKRRLTALPPVTTPHRDPRTWVISLPYLVYLTKDEMDSAKAGDDAEDIVIMNLGFDLNEVEKYKSSFAFDHYDILNTSLGILRKQAKVNPEFLCMLNEFTVSEACELVNSVAGETVILPNHFLKKYASILKNVGKRKGLASRPASVYKLDIE